MAAMSYVESDLPEGMSLTQYRRHLDHARALDNPYATNRAYAIVIAISAAIIGAPNAVAIILRRKARS